MALLFRDSFDHYSTAALAGVIGAYGRNGTQGIRTDGGDDTTISLAWANTDTLQPVTVWLKESAQILYASAAVLPAGSTRYTVTGLTANTTYDLRVTLPDGQTLALGIALPDRAG